jgi:DnaJ-class molecular chaperone
MDYKTYDPGKEGYGNKYDWKKNFYDRMGFEEAQKVLHTTMKTPLEILGLKSNYTKNNLYAAFRRSIQFHHPDHGGDTATAQQIIAAFTVLKQKLGLK